MLSVAAWTLACTFRGTAWSTGHCARSRAAPRYGGARCSLHRAAPVAQPVQSGVSGDDATMQGEQRRLHTALTLNVSTTTPLRTTTTLRFSDRLSAQNAWHSLAEGNRGVAATYTTSTSVESSEPCTWLPATHVRLQRRATAALVCHTKRAEHGKRGSLLSEAAASEASAAAAPLRARRLRRLAGLTLTSATPMA